MQSLPGGQSTQRMEVIQINLNHCRMAQDLLMQAIVESKCDVALIAEPFYVPSNNGNWVTDKARMAAIYVCGRYPIQEVLSNGEEGFVIAKVNGVYLCSCYAPPRWSIEEFERMLDVMTEALLDKRHIIIGGDLNAWAEEWNSRLTNPRGQSTLEALAKLNVLTANEGTISTFHRDGRESIVDVTFCSPSLKDDLKWRVCDSYTASDHRAIRFTVGREQVSKHVRVSKSSHWKHKLLNKEILRETFGWITGGERALSARRLTNALTDACDVAMPRVSSPRIGKDPTYWWNDEIASLRAKCLKSRRKAQRARTDVDRVERQTVYKAARAELKHAITTSKRQCFNALLEEVNRNPWGDAYRMVMVKLKGPMTPREMCPVKLKAIVEGLFPEHNPTRWPEATQNREDEESNDDSEVSKDELLKAAKSLKLNKAPGPDGIPNAALKVAVKAHPEVFMKTMQKCLEECQFPDRWKKQRLVLIPKPGKATGDPSSFRPICLLDTLGKLFEKIILNRLTKVTEGDHGLSEKQFGFRKGKSTLEAILTVTARAQIAQRKKKGGNRFCAIITLDVKNAFNSASWGAIAVALDRLGIPKNLFKLMGDYFRNRILIYDTEAGKQRKKVTAGVPQGSILGAILWNIMYDGVLRSKLPEGVEIVGFADDIVLTVMGDSREHIEVQATRAIGTVVKWMTENKLEVAHHKTEMVLVSNCKQIGTAQIEFGGNVTTSKRQVKYLGVMIDDRLNFNSHVDYVCAKAAKAQNAIARIMPNKAGPRSSVRRLIAGVVTSILRYGCVAWGDALRTKRNRVKLNQVFRLSAVRVASAYRTISYDAVCVISGLLPIHLVIEEDCRCFRSRKETGKADRQKHRETSLSNWQEEWNKSVKGRWTHRLIPSIKDWINRPHGEVNFHMTEFLSGHGGFREYLHRIKRAASPDCPACSQVVETPEHVLFECPRFTGERQELFKHVDPGVTPDNLIETMCREKSSWDAVDQMINKIMVKLQEEWSKAQT